MNLTIRQPSNAAPMEAHDFNMVRAHFRAFLGCGSVEQLATQAICNGDLQDEIFPNGMSTLHENSDPIGDIFDSSFALVPDVLLGPATPTFSPLRTETTQTLRICNECPVGKQCPSAACPTRAINMSDSHTSSCDMPEPHSDVNALTEHLAIPYDTIGATQVEDVFIKPADSLMLSLLESEDHLTAKSIDLTFLEGGNVGDWMSDAHAHALDSGNVETPLPANPVPSSPSIKDTAKRKRKACGAARGTAKRVVKREDASDDGGERTTARSASMEQHRINEKHRRRGMNESHNALRDLLGLPPSTPVTVVLSTACSCIHDLQRQEREYEQELARLRGMSTSVAACEGVSFSF